MLRFRDVPVGSLFWYGAEEDEEFAEAKTFRKISSTTARMRVPKYEWDEQQKKEVFVGIVDSTFISDFALDDPVIEIGRYPLRPGAAALIIGRSIGLPLYLTLF